MIEEEIEEIKVNLEVLIPNEEVIVTVTKDGYIKRTSLRSYSASGGKDLAMKETDRLLYKAEVHTTDVLLVFTSKGSYLYLPVHELPDIRWKDLGQHLASLVTLEKDESIIAVFAVKDFQEPLYLLFATKNGMIKRTELAAYKVQRYSRALTAIKLKEDDEVVGVHVTNGRNQVFLATFYGYGLLFSEEEASLVGPRAAGVKGINLKDGDHLVSLEVWKEDEEKDLLLVTQRGAVKKMKSTEFEPLSRAARGVVMLRELKGNPHRVVGLTLIEQETQFVLQTEKGLTEQFDFASLKRSDRYSNGTFVLDENDSGKVIAVWRDIKAEES